MADSKTKTNWIPTIVSIFFGVIIAFGATWYTIYSTRQEAREAERERLAKVKENLVAIIEEHIVNQDSLNLNSFERLISNRTREEGLVSRPSIYDLLTQAEYNIESSKHLSFDKKKEYSRIISSLYVQLSSDTTIKFTDSRYQEDISTILNSLKETKEKEGKQALSNLIKHYQEDILSENEQTIDRDSFVGILLESPTKLIVFFIIYFAVIGAYWYWMRLKRRKREYRKRLEEQFRMRRSDLLNDIERMKELLSRNKLELDSKERTQIEDRIEMLYDKLRIMEEEYYIEGGR